MDFLEGRAFSKQGVFAKYRVHKKNKNKEIESIFFFFINFNSLHVIVCPASAGWIEKKSNVCPGIAGRTYHSIKHRKYKGKVIPVIIETGGRFDEAGRDFIDKLASSQQDTHQRRTSNPASHAVFNKVALTLEKPPPR